MEAIIILTSWFAFMVYGCASTIWGRGAERAYEQRSMLFKSWLLPGRWSNKERYVRDAKALARIMLVFASLIYVVMLHRLIKEPVQFVPPRVDAPPRT